ncbi:MAG: hypothetical protein ACI3XL_06510 [Eubacteriales bacterium]
MELDKKKKLIRIIYALTTALTVLSSVLLFSAFLSAFDAELGYFNGNNALPFAFQTVYALTVLGSLVSGFAFAKDEVLTPGTQVSGGTKSAHALIGVALVLLGTLSFYLDMGIAYSGAQAYFLGIGSCGLGLYYLIIALKESYGRTKAKCACIFVSIAFAMGIVVQNNSYLGRAMNSVENTLGNIFAVSFLMYILYEGKRLCFGEENRWRAASLLFVRACALSYSCAYILAYLVGAVNESGRFYQMLYLLLVGVMADITLRNFMKNVTQSSEQSPGDATDDITPPEKSDESGESENEELNSSQADSNINTESK